jgi:PhnB protein
MDVTVIGSTIHLTVDGAARASVWYAEALDAIERNRIALPDGRLIHVELAFGDLTVMLADEFPEMSSWGPLHYGGSYGAIYLHVVDVDPVWSRALDAGATVVRPLADAFWGERDGQILDPFGHRWGLTQRLRDVPIDEMQQPSGSTNSAYGVLTTEGMPADLNCVAS